MLVNTVLDHRVLLDWNQTQAVFEVASTTVVGYSMGGQITLLLGGIDKRVSAIVSIVPPYIDDKIALVAPKNLTHRLVDNRVLLLTADNDENASREENQFLFDSIQSANKQTIEYKGEHILPDNYVDDVESWLSQIPRGILN